MEKWFMVLHREPKTDAPQGDLSTFRSAFKRTPQSKMGTVQAPHTPSMFTVRLKVSNNLLLTRRWAGVSHLNQIKLFYHFVREHLGQNGASPSPAQDIELTEQV